MPLKRGERKTKKTLKNGTIEDDGKLIVLFQYIKFISHANVQRITSLMRTPSANMVFSNEAHVKITPHNNISKMSWGTGH